METKIEYQLSPDLAEKIALEFATLRLQVLRGRQWKMPLSLGLCFAVLGFAGCSPSDITNSHVSQLFAVMGAAIGFGLGFGGACLGQASARIKITDKVKQQTRAIQEKLGQSRTASWDKDFLTISSPASQNKFKWQIFDKIVNGEFAIHGIVGDQAFFGIPKSALPSNIIAEELVEVWQSYTSKPPKLS